MGGQETCCKAVPAITAISAVTAGAAPAVTHDGVTSLITEIRVTMPITAVRAPVRAIMAPITADTAQARQANV